MSNDKRELPPEYRVFESGLHPGVEWVWVFREWEHQGFETSEAEAIDGCWEHYNSHPAVAQVEHLQKTNALMGKQLDKYADVEKSLVLEVDHLRKVVQEVPQVHTSNCALKVGDGPEACTCWVHKVRAAIVTDITEGSK